MDRFRTADSSGPRTGMQQHRLYLVLRFETVPQSFSVSAVQGWCTVPGNAIPNPPPGFVMVVCHGEVNHRAKPFAVLQLRGIASSLAGRPVQEEGRASAVVRTSSVI